MRATIIVFVVLAIASCGGIVLATDQGDQTDVATLQLKCEQAREARLKPMRDAEIANCKADRSRDPEYCERFWKDLGDATRLPNGAMKPRLFDDLPECVAAAKAKQAQNK
jgi:hypothetical protein